MPKTEKDLEKLMIDFNETRSHHRFLYGGYGYNHILGTDLLEECLLFYQEKKSKIRILDIGCGDGFALSQLKEELTKKGVVNNFEFFGIGLNKYQEMFIPEENFSQVGVLEYELKNTFDLIISVYTFQYIWHKLEAVQKIYNSLLSDRGKAIIHFPGYLVHFSKKSSDILMEEEKGNREFLKFIKQFNLQEQEKKMKYLINPYYSDDDDATLFTEFGILILNKKKPDPINFPYVLRGFSIFEEGFMFETEKLSYVNSFYSLNDTKPASAKSTKISLNYNPYVSRIITLKEKFQGKTYPLHIGIHKLSSNKIVGIYPAAKEDLTGDAVPYADIASILFKHKIGAVVRSHGLYDGSVNFPKFNDYFIKKFVDYCIKNAKELCGNRNPEIYLIGYSSGASAIASILDLYSFIKKVLLLAPSYDSEKKLLTKSLNSYKGELYIITGDRDQIILPSQAAWFYFQAKQAKIRKFVDLTCCDHSFNGVYNKNIILKSPLWAFNKNYKDFPREEKMPDNEEYPNHFF